MADLPIGFGILQCLTFKCCRLNFTNHTWFKCSVFILTYLTYMSYHASRKPLSVVKTHLYRNCSNVEAPPDLIINETTRDTWCDWAPFNTSNASFLLGILDSSFLFAYAAAMFVSGFIADRVSLRYFLAVGMLCSGFSDYLMGIAKVYNLHSLWYFIVAQIFGGIMQTTGWPGVVAVMGNWYGKSKRGLIFGIWNSHTSVGNMVGTSLASAFVETDWSLSFIIPGVMISVLGFINFLFLIESPESLDDSLTTNIEYDNFENLEETSDQSCDDSIPSETHPLIIQAQKRRLSRVSIHSKKADQAVGFFGALRIPGVLEFSLCLFFSKLVNYTFLYWLPYYIKYSSKLSEAQSAMLSTVFDVGGIFGGIMAGLLSDFSQMNATTCAVMLAISVPLLYLYSTFGALHLWLNAVLLTLVGFFVNGPYALITTAVSAELGTHPSLTNNSKALATVTAIIDGMGSIGAAVGPLLASVVSGSGWDDVFYLLITSNIIALLMLVRLLIKEFKHLVSTR